MEQLIPLLTKTADKLPNEGEYVIWYCSWFPIDSTIYGFLRGGKVETENGTQLDVTDFDYWLEYTKLIGMLEKQAKDLETIKNRIKEMIKYRESGLMLYSDEISQAVNRAALSDLEELRSMCNKFTEEDA